MIFSENLSACRAHGCRPRNIFFAARGAGGKDGTFFRRAPCGARLPSSCSASGARSFQSTRPLRGATRDLRLQLIDHAISIHAPHAGRDLGCELSDLMIRISIHAPLAGCDERKCKALRKQMKFQSTHPLRGATGRFFRGRPCASDFNPRTPCGVRLPASAALSVTRYFNPRTPCGVRLWTILPSRSSNCISIHAPLAGCDAPRGLEAVGGIAFQSTHPLRGATITYTFFEPNRRHFNPRTPCGVRLLYRIMELYGCTISIHAPLAGCDLKDSSYCSRAGAFQSTHPLRGATKIVAARDGWTNISIHAPLAGCDMTAAKSRPLLLLFQSTHPLRGATTGCGTIRGGYRISIHAPLAGCDDHVERRRRSTVISIHAPLAGCDLVALARWMV